MVPSARTNAIAAAKTLHYVDPKTPTTTVLHLSELPLMMDLMDHQDQLNSFLLSADEVKKVVVNNIIPWKAAAGTSVLSLVIISLLFGWQKMTKYFYLRQPRSFRPTQDSIFVTLAGLGVVGVSLDLITGIAPVQKALEGFSKDFFGKPDILVKNTDFAHDAFFQLGVAFALMAGLMLLRGEKKLIDIATIQEEQIDPQTGMYSLTADNLARYIRMREFNRPQEQPGYIGITREIFMDQDEWSAKILLLKNHVMDLFPSLPSDFRVESLMEESFAETMYKAVQVPFLAWVFFIPALAYSNAVDLSHGVINAGAPNAALSSGYFFDEFLIFVPAISSVIISSIWGYWNCWKMTQVKYMILPRLEPDQTNDGRPVIRPPPMYNDYVRSSFDASPPSLRRVERFWGKEPQTIYDDLFGQAGSAGLDLYSNSIKYQAWMTLTNIVFFAIQILPRDLEVMVDGAKAGDPQMVAVELYAYGILLAFSIFNLFWVTPRTFWNYCVVSCMDGENLVELLRLSGYGSPQQVAQPRVTGGPPLRGSPMQGGGFGMRNGNRRLREDDVFRPGVGGYNTANTYIESENDIM
jgi:hypothetical protein